MPPILAAPLVPLFNRLVEVDFLDWLVMVVVTGIFVAFMIGGVALWRLPEVFPGRYEHRFYRLPRPLLKLVAVGNVVASFVFTLLVASSAPSALALVLAAIAFSGVVYVVRLRMHRQQDVGLRERMALLHRHERIDRGDDEPEE